MISLSKQELALQKQIDKTYQETYEYEDFIQSPPTILSHLMNYEPVQKFVIYFLKKR